MNDITVTQKQIEGLLGEMRELGQPRSDYALAHFVVGQHDLPGAQRKQVLDELQAMMFALADVNDEKKTAEIDLAEILELHDEKHGYEWQREEIKIGGLRRKILSLELHLEGRLRECETLLAMLDRIPKYTREQYEAEEPEHWARRLTRQFVLHQRGDFGNLDALLQMETEPGKAKPAFPVNAVVSTFLPEVKNECANSSLPAGRSD
jgi:hypothetical protein